MRLSKELSNALSAQVAKEYENMQLYNMLYSYFAKMNLGRIAHMFKAQAKEEATHAKKIVHYLNERIGGNYTPTEIKVPDVVFSTPLQAANLYLQAELNTTASFEAIYKLAVSEESFMDLSFIQKMLKIQIEEEESAQRFLAHIQMAKDLLLFNKMLPKY